MRRVVVCAVAVVTALTGAVVAAPAADATSSIAPCSYNATTEAITGANGTASAIGWLGNAQGVVTCLGGSFHVQGTINKTFGFGIYSGQPLQWNDANGYLPAQVTTFTANGLGVAITEFADKVTIKADDFVVVYARVAVTNRTAKLVAGDPKPSPGFVRLAYAPVRVAPGTTVTHDYAVAVDRFGAAYPWPAAKALRHAGAFDDHYAHMRNFWNVQLSKIAAINVPDPQLVDAYKSGFITTQIARSGNRLDTGVNNYEMEFNHDVVGILTNLFTQGYDDNAHDLLLELRDIVALPWQYEDGIWTYAWPWAEYLLKTGDLDVREGQLRDRRAEGPRSNRASKTPRIALRPTAPVPTGSWV